MVGSGNPRQHSCPSTNGVSCPAMTLHWARAALRCWAATSAREARRTRNRCAQRRPVVLSPPAAARKNERRSGRQRKLQRLVVRQAVRVASVLRGARPSAHNRIALRCVGSADFVVMKAPPEPAGPGSTKRGRCARALVAWPLRKKRLRARSPGDGGSNAVLLGASLLLRERRREGRSSSPQPSRLPDQAAREIAAALGSVGAGNRKLSVPACRGVLLNSFRKELRPPRGTGSLPVTQDALGGLLFGGPRCLVRVCSGRRVLGTATRPLHGQGELAG